MPDGAFFEAEEPPVDDDEVEDLLEDLEDLEDAVDSPAERRVVQRTIDTVTQLTRGRIFGVDDVAQQVVGGVILSAPFVVTEEVWSLAATMNQYQWAVTVLMVLTIGWGTLYRANDARDADREHDFLGIPLRYLSLLSIAYLSVAVLALVFNAPETFGASLWTTLKAISIGAIFSVVGAATADSIF